MENDLLSLRVAKLERQLKFWRVAVVLLAVVIAVSVVGRLTALPTQSEAAAVTAHEFNLVNKSGRVIGHWGAIPNDSDFPVFELNYPNDKQAVFLGVKTATEAGVGVLDINGRVRALMAEDAYGPTLSVSDSNGKIIWVAPSK